MTRNWSAWLSAYNALLDLSAAAEPAAETLEEQLQEEPEYREEATPEEIYKAQVSHHYIGALR